MKWVVWTLHLVQLSAEALEYVLLVDLKDGLAFIEHGVDQHAQGVHIRSHVTADGQDVLRSDIFWVREAERREIGVPLFTNILGLKDRNT